MIKSKTIGETRIMTRQEKTVRLVKMSMLAAISIVLVALLHFPLLPAATYLEYDPADIPIFIGTFAFGPMAGFVLTAVVSLIQGITVSAGSGPQGILMHIVATGAFVIVAGNIYKRKKTRKGALISLVAGTGAMILIMIPANLIVTPAFTGLPVPAVAAMLPTVIIPFNLMKAGINSLLTFILYKFISRLLH